MASKARNRQHLAEVACLCSSGPPSGRHSMQQTTTGGHSLENGTRRTPPRCLQRGPGACASGPAGEAAGCGSAAASSRSWRCACCRHPHPPCLLPQRTTQSMTICQLVLQGAVDGETGKETTQRASCQPTNAPNCLRKPCRDPGSMPRSMQHLSWGWVHALTCAQQ
jgi:hypothetical protein